MHYATQLQRRRNGDDMTSTVTSTPPPTAPRRRPASDRARGARLGGSLQQLLAFVSLIVILVFFSIASPYFFTPSNLVGILMAATVTGILALGHDLRHHHRRDRPLDRHRHDPVRRDDRRVPHLLGLAGLGSACSARSCSAA